MYHGKCIREQQQPRGGLYSIRSNGNSSRDQRDNNSRDYRGAAAGATGRAGGDSSSGGKQGQQQQQRQPTSSSSSVSAANKITTWKILLEIRDGDKRGSLSLSLLRNLDASKNASMPINILLIKINIFINLSLVIAIIDILVPSDHLIRRYRKVIKFRPDWAGGRAL